MGKNKTKNNGQVFTPPFMVNLMLNICGYYGETILHRHVIDNSCGNGAFLIKIVKRYCDAVEDKTEWQNFNTDSLFKHLEKYIHGIELDEKLCKETKNRLNHYISERYSIQDANIEWDIRCCDTLSCDEYDGRMDFVTGNPPYVRIHNLNEQYDNVKRYRFSDMGMTDLYLPFFLRRVSKC